MIRTFRILRASISAWYYELFILIAVNLTWLVLSLLILPIGPATAGLFHVANQVAKGEPLFFSLFWQGMRRHLKMSVQLSIVLIATTALLVVNIAFYFGLSTSIGQIIGIIWIYVLIFWALVMNYPFALLVEMDKPGIIKILRNSALLAMDNVVFTVSISLWTLIVIALSIFPLGLLPFPFGFFSLLAIFQCKALATLIEKYEKKQNPG